MNIFRKSLLFVAFIFGLYLAWAFLWFASHPHTGGAPEWPHAARFAWWLHFETHKLFGESPTRGTYRFWIMNWTAVTAAALLITPLVYLFLKKRRKRSTKN